MTTETERLAAASALAVAALAWALAWAGVVRTDARPSPVAVAAAPPVAPLPGLAPAPPVRRRVQVVRRSRAS